MPLLSSSCRMRAAQHCANNHTRQDRSRAGSAGRICRPGGVAVGHAAQRPRISRLDPPGRGLRERRAASIRNKHVTKQRDHDDVPGSHSQRPAARPTVTDDQTEQLAPSFARSMHCLPIRCLQDLCGHSATGSWPVTGSVRGTCACNASVPNTPVSGRIRTFQWHRQAGHTVGATSYGAGVLKSDWAWAVAAGLLHSGGSRKIDGGCAHVRRAKPATLPSLSRTAVASGALHRSQRIWHTVATCGDQGIEGCAALRGRGASPGGKHKTQHIRPLRESSGQMHSDCARCPA